MIEVSNADRVVFPEIPRTKGDVVAYYARVAERAFPHVEGRLVSLRRYPKILSGPGFFQKNVPDHYPETIARFPVPRSQEATKRHRDPKAKGSDVTVYPILRDPEHLAYVANQGAIEIHVPTARAHDLFHPDRLIIDLDPPEGGLALVRRAALLVRDTLSEFGLPSVPVATGSKGYHVIAPIAPTAGSEELAVTAQKLAAILAARHPDTMTTAYRIANRGDRVFIDWLRNNPLATVIVPYSLRAKPRASVATPLSWDEIEATPPDAFTIDDVDRLLDRPDTLRTLAAAPADSGPFIAAVDAAFERAALVLERFDRFRS